MNYPCRLSKNAIMFRPKGHFASLADTKVLNIGRYVTRFQTSNTFV